MFVAGGAGAAGGYYASAEERSAGTVVDDAAITGTIKAKYISEKDISAININVDTYRGVVTLYGSVPRKEIEDKAVRIAWQVKGVKQVVSKLTIVPE